MSTRNITASLRRLDPADTWMVNPDQYATELATADNWHLSGNIDCTSLVAQVFWVDPETQQEGEFAYPGGKPVLLNFQVCP